MTAAEIAERIRGKVIGNGSIQLTGFAPADAAKPGDLTFAENEDYFARAEKSAASAILVDGDFSSPNKVLIRVPKARVAVTQLLPLFFPPTPFVPGRHPSSVIAASAQVDATAHIGPHCVIGERTRIGAKAVLEGGNHVGDDCVLGESVRLFPNVVLYPRTQIGNRVMIHAGSVIGADGFGYVFHEGAHQKVAQIGNVVIHDDVEIGANVTID